MACGHTTAISTSDERPYQPISHRCPECVIRHNVIMVARGMPDVEDGITGGEHHSCGRSRRQTTRLAAEGPART